MFCSLLLVLKLQNDRELTTQLLRLRTPLRTLGFLPFLPTPSALRVRLLLTAHAPSYQHPTSSQQSIIIVFVIVYSVTFGIFLNIPNLLLNEELVPHSTFLMYIANFC